MKNADGEDVLTTAELIELLLAASPEAPVYLEGGDDIGPAWGVRVDDDSVLIARTDAYLSAKNDPATQSPFRSAQPSAQSDRS